MEDLFPLFPLGLVALPGEEVPLHIFEARYRVMFEKLLASDGTFAIVWADVGSLREVGCACRVEDVLEHHEDGRLDVLCRGVVPVVIDGPLEHVPYPAAAVRVLEDDDGLISPEAVARAQAELLALVDLVHASSPDDADLSTMDAYAMAARVDLDLAVKQRLLEERHEDARLAIVADELEQLRQRLRGEALDSARARSNGRVRL